MTAITSHRLLIPLYLVSSLSLQNQTVARTLDLVDSTNVASSLDLAAFSTANVLVFLSHLVGYYPKHFEISYYLRVLLANNL